MDVKWTIIWGVVSSIIAVILTAAVKEYYFRKKNSVFRFVRKFKIFHSGMQGYYYSFPEEDNFKVWKQYATREFCYMGISAETLIKNNLLDFMRSDQGKNVKYKFLLLNPDKEDALKNQEAYRNGLKDFDGLDKPHKEKLLKDVEITKSNILGSVQKIKNAGCSSAEIKYYEDFAPWWQYLFNGNKMFLGLLEPGKDGRKSPLVIFERDDRYYTLFNTYETHWNRVWENATKVL